VRPDPLSGVVHLANLAMVLGPWAERLPRRQVPVQKLLAAAGACAHDLVSALGRPCWSYLGESAISEARRRAGQHRRPVSSSFTSAAMLAAPSDSRLSYGLAALASWIIVGEGWRHRAYSVGRLVGRHKITPLLSPSKTWKGRRRHSFSPLWVSWAVFAVPGLAARPGLGLAAVWDCSWPRWAWPRDCGELAVKRDRRQLRIPAAGCPDLGAS